MKVLAGDSCGSVDCCSARQVSRRQVRVFGVVAKNGILGEDARDMRWVGSVPLKEVMAKDMVMF